MRSLINFERETHNFFLVQLLLTSVVGRMSKSELRWCNLYFVFPMPNSIPPPLSPHLKRSFSLSLSLSLFSHSLSSLTLFHSSFFSFCAPAPHVVQVGGEGTGVWQVTHTDPPLPPHRRKSRHHGFANGCEGRRLRSELGDTIYVFVRPTKSIFFSRESARKTTSSYKFHLAARSTTYTTAN